MGLRATWGWSEQAHPIQKLARAKIVARNNHSQQNLECAQ
jgi:hypothetical protein